MKKKNFSCELALLGGLLINSLSVDLMVKSAFGISTLSSVPLVLSTVIPGISFGMMNFIVQASLILLLILVTRQPKITYLGSFIISFLFGVLVDFFTPIVGMLPDLLVLRILYFIIGITCMSFGAALFMKCKLPVLPFDLFVRDLASYYGYKIKSVRTVMDIIAISISAGASYFVLRKIIGIGIGTVFCAVFFGSMIHVCAEWLSKNFEFEPTFSFSKPIIQAGEIKKGNK